MLETLPDDVMLVVLATIDDAPTSYAILPSVCRALRRSIRKLNPVTLTLPGNLPWQALATSPARQDALITWFASHQRVESLAVHIAAWTHDGSTLLAPDHRTLTAAKHPWAAILPMLTRLTSLTLGSVHLSLLPTIARCTTLTELRIRLLGPCEAPALTAALGTLSRLVRLQSMEVNATRWAVQRRTPTTGVPHPPGTQPSVADAATTPRASGTGPSGPPGAGAAHAATTQPDAELPSTSLLVPVTVVEAVRDEASAELLWAARHQPVRYPVAMLPAGPRTPLPASLTRVQGLRRLVVHSMARPEFPAPALDVSTLTELEYVCEWVPRGGFDTVMHLLAPPFVLPDNLMDRLPHLRRLVLRGCELGCSRSLQARAEALGVPLVEVGPLTGGPCLLQRSLLLGPGAHWNEPNDSF